MRYPTAKHLDCEVGPDLRAGRTGHDLVTGLADPSCALVGPSCASTADSVWGWHALARQVQGEWNSPTYFIVSRAEFGIFQGRMPNAFRDCPIGCRSIASESVIGPASMRILLTSALALVSVHLCQGERLVAQGSASADGA